ncbi:magnesium transporter CorA family protein [soil metagenome]
MITVYFEKNRLLQSQIITNEDLSLLQKAIWIDLLCPTDAEETLIETYLKFNIPSKKEMQAIEPSSRFYHDNNAVFMTATVIANSTSSAPSSEAVTFIFTEMTLVTIRYSEPQSFSSFISSILKQNTLPYNVSTIFIGLLESSVDRLADILESVTSKLDDISQTIFRPKISERKTKGINYKKLLQEIGANGDLGAKSTESLISFNRLISYFKKNKGTMLDSNQLTQLELTAKDIDALSDHAAFISNKVGFLLDATLGMVNIEQSNIIKIFSVAAVIFLPPTLIASIYGMNFHVMPELHWALGYPFALVLMIISAWLPYQYFKHRKWL